MRDASVSGVDVVVLAPSRSEQRDDVWIREAADLTAAQLSPGGIAYIVPAASGRLRRALASAGIGAAGTLLHIPSVAHSRHIVPLGTAAERYALSGRLPMSRLKRLAAVAALRMPWLARFGPTAAVHRRHGAPPLGQWLFELGEPRRLAGSVLVSVSETGNSIALHRFPAGQSQPDAVAKVSPGAGRELRALREIAPGAAVGGARVPEVLAAGEIGTVPFVLQSALAGRTAAVLVLRRRVTARGLQEQLAAWLDRWSASTASPRALSAEDIDRFVLGLAVELAPQLGSSYPTYLDHLRELSANAIGQACPFVPSHGDLTLANVLLDGSAIGVVDWEHASADSLPLLDFFYSAVDAVAAESAYADRAAAFNSCFAPGGAHAADVRALLRRLVTSLAVDSSLQELCFHACWLHHAANETRRVPAYPGPFMTILRTIAGDSARFSLPGTTR